MTIQELCQLYAMHPKVRALAKTLGEKSSKTILLEGLVGSAAPMAFAALGQRREERGERRENSFFLVILNDAEEAGYFYHDLVQMLGDKQVLFFPSSYRRAVKYAQRDAANEILRTEVLTYFSRNEERGTRKENAVLAEESHQEKTIADISRSSFFAEQSGRAERLVPRSSLYVVTYPEALAEMVVDQRVLCERTLTLTTGQLISVADIETTLHDFGFREVDYVYEPGQYALRGSILDVYSYNSEYPFRIDFFGDEIDSVRTFEVDDQLSRDRRDQVEIVPELAASSGQKVSLLTFLPDDAVLVAKDLSFVRDVIDRTYDEGFSKQAIQERLEEATEMEQAEIEQQLRRESQLMTGAQFMADAERFRRVLLSRNEERGTRKENSSRIIFTTKAQPLFHKNFELLMPALEDYVLKGYKLYILADSTKQIERLRDILAEKSDLSFEGVDRTLHAGFVDDDAKLCLFTDHQIFDRFHKYNLKSDKARSGKMALTLKEIQQFEVGDFVVHVDHGVGRFGGLVRMPINRGERREEGGECYQEMIKITYQHGDAIYVSIHSLYKVSKYKSQDGGEAPRLSTLGTGQWERLKERTKKHIKDIARDLIKLYAARRREKGFAFSHDTYLQQELEASFLYEDTPDQLKATQDVKADMEQAKPMDRLVCGDVGFGKTEVAVRAAFKAACDGKQVAVMVPTTVLAYQHYRTFSSRLKDMPVRVDYLTRARTAKQTTALLKDLADGKIDILIGTHKLIGKTVKFKDLGLLIIDEEQKFGVSTKEKLRQMRTNVDTLTMSATPIPRTLQFSLVGARDLSVIQTPPPNRYPIQTEIHTFGAEIISDAINFELSRNGQVYFVNNRINQLREIADMIHKYVPDARVAIGHGQMKPEELEQIILDFSNHDYDVLLSTTIVENGIDIPNANTIIINGAHNFGLSDLHQMRGRVGRGNRKAFCYLLAPPLAALPQDSRRRLEALENFSDLGSGINIAMQDLDIRGAGNLLGAEQSGFISDLGYETYQKILNEAMAELRNEDRLEMKNERYDYSKGEKPEAKGNHISHLSSFTSHIDFVADCSLESDLEMYFPDQYVPSDSERMLLYRELDNVRDDRELEAYRQRLVDRFGPVPPCGEELIRVVPLRRLGKQLGCEKILLKQGRMFLYFVSQSDSPYYQSDVFGRVIDYATKNLRRCNLREQNGKRSMVVTDIPTVAEAVAVLTAI